MTQLVANIFKNEERSKTVLAAIAAVGGVAAIIIAIVASLVK